MHVSDQEAATPGPAPRSLGLELDVPSPSYVVRGNSRGRLHRDSRTRRLAMWCSRDSVYVRHNPPVVRDGFHIDRGTRRRVTVRIGADQPSATVVLSEDESARYLAGRISSIPLRYLGHPDECRPTSRSDGSGHGRLKFPERVKDAQRLLRKMRFVASRRQFPPSGAGRQLRTRAADVPPLLDQ